MTAALFLVLLFGAVPVSIVLAMTAISYIQQSGNTVLFDSFAQQMFAGTRITACSPSRFSC